MENMKRENEVQEKEELHSFVIMRDGEVVGGQSQFLTADEVPSYIERYKRAYRANKVIVYVCDSRTGYLILK